MWQLCKTGLGGRFVAQKDKNKFVNFFPLQTLSLADWITLYFLYIYLPAEDVLRLFS